jgi:hypothetical protein
MISHRYKCVFVEVPKTASTSVRAVLGTPPKPHLNLWQIKFLMENYWTGSGGWGNRLAEAAYLLLPAARRRRVGQRQFESYFKFGFVRNPWDRAVSLYKRREGMQLRDRMSFDQFVEWVTFSSATCLHPMPHRNQLDWFVDPHGNVVADFIGKFETLRDDWAFVCRKLGIDAPLPHLNENPSARHYTEYYTPRTRRIIADRFRVDVEHFGYTFEGLASAGRAAA